MHSRNRRSFVRLPLAALTALSLLATLGAPSAGAQDRPQFRSDVELIQLQITVVDDDGQFVTGLSAEDFRLRIDGDDRRITTVYEVNVGAADAVRGAVAEVGTDVGTEEEAAAAVPPGGWRQWLLFFDAGFNSPRGVREAQIAASNFLDNQVQPLDLVGVATYNVIAGVQLLVPMTTDREQVRNALMRLGLRQAPGSADQAGVIAQMASEAIDVLDAPQEGDVTPGGGGGITDQEIQEALQEVIRSVEILEFEQYVAVADQYSAQLGTLAQLLQTIRGRKHVVMFSKGFSDQVLGGESLSSLSQQMEDRDADVGLAIAQAGDSQRFGSSQVRDSLDSSVQMLQAADAVVHVIDPSGVGGERDSGLSRGGVGAGTFTETGSRRSALAALADGTGGTVTWDTNDLTVAMAAIEESTRSFYVVAFPRERGDDDVLDIDIEVTRAGLEISAAPQRIAAPVDFEAMTPMQRQAQLAEFLAKGIEDRDINFTLTATAFRGNERVNRMGVVVEVPWSQLEEIADARDDGRAELEIMSYTVAGDGRIVDLSNRQVGLNIEQMGKSPVAGLPFRFYDLLWAWPDDGMEVRTMLREAKIGRLSAVKQPVASPAPGGQGPWLSGPLGFDDEHPGLIMRGFDAANPPAMKADGPVAFPYMVGDYELTPMAQVDVQPGGILHMYAVVNNLARSPFNGSTEINQRVMLIAPDGTEIPVADGTVRGLINQPDGSTQVAIDVPIPRNFSGGMYQARLDVMDMVSNATASGVMEFWVDAR